MVMMMVAVVVVHVVVPQHALVQPAGAAVVHGRGRGCGMVKGRGRGVLQRYVMMVGPARRRHQVL